MYCRNCKKKVADLAVVCVHCGFPQKRQKFLPELRRQNRSQRGHLRQMRGAVGPSRQGLAGHPPPLHFPGRTGNPPFLYRKHRHRYRPIGDPGRLRNLDFGRPDPDRHGFLQGFRRVRSCPVLTVRPGQGSGTVSFSLRLFPFRSPLRFYRFPSLRRCHPFAWSETYFTCLARVAE